MAQRKLQLEIDKTFKKVSEGVQAFETIYDKIQQSSNASQKEKLEDALKKEIKKLQRSRDLIKAWAQMNDIKDKKPLVDHRKLIETQMEKFKAVEKEMKTKAYSKEGLSAGQKLDPKEKEKLESCQFLSNMVDELDRQVETLEAEVESLQANVKKGRKDFAKAERIAELEHTAERHKWHQGKLELLLRALENGQVDSEQVKNVQDNIQYYVESNQDADFLEDDTMYDELNLEEEEDMYGMTNDTDRVSSQDTQSIQDDMQDTELKQIPSASSKQKANVSAEPSSAAARRPSNQIKSPLPVLATLHTSLPSVSTGQPAAFTKPPPLPSKPSGEPLKYASAAAAAAASDKGGVGIAPLPPPPSSLAQSQSSPGSANLPPPAAPRPPAVPTAAAVSSAAASNSKNSSPKVGVPQPAPSQAPSSRSTATVTSPDGSTILGNSKSPAPSHSSLTAASTISGSIPPTPALEKIERLYGASRKSSLQAGRSESAERKSADRHTPHTVPDTEVEIADDDDAIYHLPASLQDLIESFEAAKNMVSLGPKQADDRLLALSHATCPDAADAERPRHYRPKNPYPFTPSHYPQEPLSIFDDSRLYSRVDIDTLFYTFYFRQGTYEQYLAAKALKAQSWRFHKQYQTWFQRHEEPKSITDEYEQGTYRFFDYESTWMNRRKGDFKFCYKFLEDDF